MALLPDFSMATAAAALGDFLQRLLTKLLEKTGEDVRSFMADRIKRSFAERRDELVPFLREMQARGGDYATAADRLFKLMKRWQKGKPGQENSEVKSLVELYGAFDPPDRPVRPERLVIPAGKGGAISAPLAEIYEREVRDYRRDLRAYEDRAQARAEARFEFFKWLGLQSLQEIEAILEAVRDNGFWQLVVALPIYEIKRASRKVGSAVKGTWRVTDAAAGKAAVPLGQLADWINAQP